MKILIICLIAWAVAQITKVLLGLWREHRFNWGYFVSAGGMPSSHSATVAALATSVGLIYGADDVSFAIATILALVVMYDAAGIRRAVSRQAFILNRIMRELRQQRPRDEVEKDVRELVGHSPFQVFIGMAMGVIIAGLGVLIT